MPNYAPTIRNQFTRDREEKRLMDQFGVQPAPKGSVAPNPMMESIKKFLDMQQRTQGRPGVRTNPGQMMQQAAQPPQMGFGFPGQTPPGFTRTADSMNQLGTGGLGMLGFGGAQTQPTFQPTPPFWWMKYMNPGQGHAPVQTNPFMPRIG